MKKIITFLLVLTIVQVEAQEFIPLWTKGKMPNSKGLVIKDSINNERIMQVGMPGIHAFFTSNQENKGAAVLIIPGGGYHHLSYNISGFQLAKWFNTIGINAFVLTHRLPISPDLKEREKAPLQDAERAMRIIRKDDFAAIGDDFDAFSFQPNFMILVSPVIDMGKEAHKGSLENLLGINPSAELVKKYSLQFQVSDYTPPTFIADAFNDKTVSPKNSLLFYEALLENKIPSSLHIFNQGGHAIALRNNPGSANLWTSLCEQWLMEINMLKN
jgi:acetyl esterase/lipase